MRNITKARTLVTILGIKIDSSPRVQLLNRVLQLLKENQKFLIVTPNPEIILLSKTDSALKDALNSADISIPDGIGVLFAAKILGDRLNERIQGRLFMLDILEIIAKNNLKICLLGGNHAVISNSISFVKSNYENLSVHGFIGPKLGQDGKTHSRSEENKELELINQINEIKPDILFIGFGAPKQEKWFYLNKDKLNVKGAMVVGGSLDVLSGIKKSPPKIFSTLGFEWLWRLIQEPRRIKRIVSATVSFPIAVVLERLRYLFR